MRLALRDPIGDAQRERGGSPPTSTSKKMKRVGPNWTQNSFATIASGAMPISA